MSFFSNILVTADYRYGFNGKENDDEVSGEGNHQDYGYRHYSARLGRFLSTDPLKSTYPMLSTYQYASNTPVQAIDLDGLEAWVVTWASQSSDKNGNMQIGHTGIIVKNYKEVKNEVYKTALIFNSAKGGYDVEVTKEIEISYEPTGSYTYYDFWPKGTDLTGKAAVKDVDSYSASESFGKISDGIVIKDDADLEQWLKNHDASQIDDINNGYTEQIGIARGSSEGRPSEGILKMELDPEQSFNLGNAFQTIVNQNNKYNGLDNNCTSFVCQGLKAIDIFTSKEMIFDAYNIVVGEVLTFSYTPNETYKQLIKRPDVKVVKSAANETKESYEDAVLDN